MQRANPQAPHHGGQRSATPVLRRQGRARVSGAETGSDGSVAGLRRGRRDAVDFWRGFILLTIFVNHVPGNVFERLTYRNLGLSDSAEAFVFISGASLAMAYGRRFVPGGRRAVLGRLLTRAGKLYGTHVALSLGALVLFSLGATAAGLPDLMAVHGRELFRTDPWSGLVGIMTLGHQLGYFNILPNYVLLVAFAPALFLLARVNMALMLGVSAALYLLCRATGANLPTWPYPGRWFFDPLAWQLMMAIGIAAGFAMARGSLPTSRPLTLAAVAVVCAAAVVVTDAFTLAPGLWDWVRGWADLDKTVLGLGRVVHFLALVYLVHAWKISDVVRLTPLFEPLCTVGRHGLGMFSLLSLLAATAQIVGAARGHSLALDAVLVGGGLVVLYGAARWLDRGVRFDPMLGDGAAVAAQT